MKIRILIVDDHVILREGLRTLLERHTDFDVVGECGDAESALAKIKGLMPDIVVMDITLPGQSGIDVTRRIRGSYPKVKVIGLSMHTERAFIYEMLRAGAAGYLIKDAASEELVRAIHGVMRGQVCLSSSIIVNMVDDFVYPIQDRKKPGKVMLTIREVEVLQLLARGNSTKEIAGCLGVSIKTIETHRRQIMDKLGMYTIAELTTYAIQKDIIS